MSTEQRTSGRADATTGADAPELAIGAARTGAGSQAGAPPGLHLGGSAGSHAGSEAPLGYVSLEQMLCRLLDRIRAELEVDTAVVLLLDEDRDMLVARAARGLEQEVR